MAETERYRNLTVELDAIGVQLYARIYPQEEDLRQAFTAAGIKPSLLVSRIPLPDLGELLAQKRELGKALWALLFEEKHPRGYLAKCLNIARQFTKEFSRDLRIRLRIIPTFCELPPPDFYELHPTFNQLQPTYRQLCDAGILSIPQDLLEHCECNRLDWIIYLPWESVLKESLDGYQISMTRALPQYDFNVQKSSHYPKGIIDILLVSASPTDLENTGAEASIASIKEIFREAGRGAFKVEWLEHARHDTLAEKLAEKEWDIIHILAHGSSEEDSSEGGIHTEDDEGVARHVYGYQLKDLLKASGKPLPQLVFLQVCDSAAAFGSLYRGLAQSIHAAGVPYVIGMQTPVSEPSARKFTEYFYKKLAQLTTTEMIDLAIAHAREQLMPHKITKKFIREALSNNPVLKFCPVDVGLTFDAITVLYMRDKADGRLKLTALPPAIRWPDGKGGSKVMLLINAGHDNQFYIDKYPLTVDQFRRFDMEWKCPFDAEVWLKHIGVIDDNSTVLSNEEKSEKAKWTADIPNFPATGVSVDQAMAYASNLGKRLPTEEEWLAAFDDAYPADVPSQNEHNCSAYWQYVKKKKFRPSVVYEFQTKANADRPQDLPGNCNEIVLCKKWSRYGFLGGSFNNSFCRFSSPYTAPHNDVGFRCVVDPDTYRKLYIEKNLRKCEEEEGDHPVWASMAIQNF